MKQLSILSLLLLAACGEKTPEQEWATNLAQRCLAMKGNYHYDKKEHTVECYRAPIGRMTKTLFHERFLGGKP